jgi:hypothetical protein
LFPPEGRIIVAALIATCIGLLLLPLGLKLAIKKFFGRNMSYFVSFLIVLATSMVFSVIVSFFGRSVR